MSDSLVRKKLHPAVLLWLLAPAMLWGHEGPAPSGAAVETIERELQGAAGTYRIVVGYTPQPVVERRETEFEFKVVRMLEIPDPLLGSQVPLLGRQLTARFRSLDTRAFLTEPLEPHSEGEEGVFGIHHGFPESGPYSLVISIEEEGGQALELELPFQVLDNPYDAWTRVVSNGLLVLLAIPVLITLWGRRDRVAGPHARLLAPLPLVGLLGLVLLVNMTLVHRLSGSIYAYNAPEPGAIELGFREESGSTVFEVSQDLIRDFDIQAVLAREQAFNSAMVAQGRIVAKPELRSEITAPLWGRIEYAREPLAIGDFVRRGQPLVNVILELSSVERKDLMDRYEEIQSALEEAEKRFQVTGEALEQVIDLAEEKQIPAEEIDWARQRHESAREELETLQKQHAQYQKVMKWRDPRFTPVISPLDGYITEIYFVPGELNPDGETRRLFSIVDLSQVWIQAEIPERDVGRLFDLKAARLRPRAYPDQEVRARLRAVHPEIDEATRRLKVLFEADNPGHRLKLGMWVDVRMESKRLQRSASVPETALLKEGGETVVYVTDGRGLFERRSVETGSRLNGQVQIVSGLSPGESVVVNGFYQLRSLQQRRNPIQTDHH